MFRSNLEVEHCRGGFKFVLFFTLILFPVHFLTPYFRCNRTSQPLVLGVHTFQTMMPDFFGFLSPLELWVKINPSSLSCCSSCVLLLQWEYLSHLPYFLFSGCSQVEKEINDNTLEEIIPIVLVSLLAQTLGHGRELHYDNQDDQLWYCVSSQCCYNSL